MTTAIAATSARCSSTTTRRTAMRRSPWRMPATASSCAAAMRWPGSPGRATCCRATAAWCSTCRWRATTASRSPGASASSTSPTTPGITCFPLSGRIAAHSYATVSLDTRDAVLTRRRYPYDTPEVIPHDQWRFACVESGVGGETQSVGTRGGAVRRGTSTCRPASSPAGSMSLSIRRRIRWCMASATSRCATSSAS